MTDPQNPLDAFTTYKLLSMIAVFKDTESAEETKLSLDRTLDMGSSIGNGIVILNDARPTPTHLISLKHIFEWHSIRMGHTFSMGEAMIADRNATHFISFLKEIVDRWDTSLDNLTFSMKLFWIVDDENNVDNDIIETSHFYFSCPEIRHSVSGQYNYLSLPMIALHDTKCQLPNYANLYGVTITHKDGNLHDVIPEPDPVVPTILPRGAEDELKMEPREERIDLSEPMKTLGDVMEALQADLKARNTIHRGQLQKWQAVIRDDFVNKLDPDPQQEKEIPIEYEIKLNDGYDEYEIDNRNLPFEQPEQKQTETGIRVIPTKVGEPLSETINRVMSLSTKVGEDVEDGYTYKIVTTWRRMKSGIIKYDININKHEFPENEQSGKDTGPGDSAVDGGLEFTYKTGDSTDIVSIEGRTAKNDKLDIIEFSASEEDGLPSYGGDREGISAEREKDVNFFRSSFSGTRNFVKQCRVLGVEHPREMANMQIGRFPLQTMDDSIMTISIHGNPDLLSDLWRKPSDVANNNPGETQHYRNVERSPMYAKLKIINAMNQSGDDLEPEAESDIPQFHHEDTHMHLYQVESVIQQGVFYQRLVLKRRDNIV